MNKTKTKEEREELVDSLKDVLGNGNRRQKRSAVAQLKKLGVKVTKVAGTAEVFSTEYEVEE